ncbi:START [Musa troglodytarum]|uniref:START n=1 Tax=Musa troglodytarum TaxID=320322 RepID=A0A9E7HW19_9LILI|nr:START [Musa troglodytarum]
MNGREAATFLGRRTVDAAACFFWSSTMVYCSLVKACAGRESLTTDAILPTSRMPNSANWERRGRSEQPTVDGGKQHRKWIGVGWASPFSFSLGWPREANVAKVLEVLDGVAHLVADDVGVAGGHSVTSTVSIWGGCR